MAGAAPYYFRPIQLPVQRLLQKLGISIIVCAQSGPEGDGSLEAGPAGELKRQGEGRWSPPEAVSGIEKNEGRMHAAGSTHLLQGANK